MAAAQSIPTPDKGRIYFHLVDRDGKTREYWHKRSAVRAARRDYPENRQPLIYKVDYSADNRGDIYTKVYPA